MHVDSDMLLLMDLIAACAEDKDNLDERDLTEKGARILNELLTETIEMAIQMLADSGFVYLGAKPAKGSNEISPFATKNFIHNVVDLRNPQDTPNAPRYLN